MLRNSLRKSARRSRGAALGSVSRPAARKRPQARRLSLEPLEQRVLLTAGALDPTFGVGGKVLTDFLGTNEDSAVATAFTGDGKIVVAGGTSGNGSAFAVARLNLDGSLDTTFGTDGKATADLGAREVSATDMALDPASGKIVVVGTAGNEIGIAVFNPDGSLDTTFDDDGRVAGLSGYAEAVAIDSSGKILVAGISRDSRFLVARYNTDGTLDASFGSGGVVTTSFGTYAEGRDIAIDQSGRIVVAGTGDGNSGDWCFLVARYTGTGSLDTSFDGDGIARVDFWPPGQNEWLGGLAIDHSGRIVLAGWTGYGIAGMSASISVARLTDSGAFDTTFDGDGKVVRIAAAGRPDSATDVAVDSSNRILVAANLPATYGPGHVMRYNEDGSPDTSFDGDGISAQATIFNPNVGANALALDGNGLIIVVGSANGAAFSESDFALVGFNTDGGLDAGFGNNGQVVVDFFGSRQDFARDVAIGSDGKIVVVGGSGRDSSVPYDFAVARYGSDGSLDPTFGTGGRVTTDFGHWDGATAVALQNDGKIVVAGQSYPYWFGNEPVEQLAVARYRADGTLDADFATGGLFSQTLGVSIGTGSGPDPFSLAIDASGRIVVAGCAKVRGSNNYDFLVARLTPDGILDTTFDGDGVALVDFGPTDEICNAIAIDDLGRIVLAGFTYNSGNGDILLARLNPDGSLDSTFDGDGKVVTDSFDNVTNKFANPEDLLIDGSGRIVVVGYGWNGRVGVARYLSNGSLDTAFNGDGRVVVPGMIEYSGHPSVALDSKGRLVIAGDYWAGPNNGTGLTRLNSDGSADFDFNRGNVVHTDLAPGDDFTNNVALQPDGKIVVVGGAYTLGPTGADFAIARFDATNPPPVPEAGGPYDVTEGGCTVLNGSTTDAYYPNSSLIYQWNLDGDEFFGETGTAASRGDETGQYPTFSADGLAKGTTLTVTLHVSDPAGATGEDTATITVVDAPPAMGSLSLDRTTVNVGGTVHLSGDFTDLSPSDTHKVRIEWGDGGDDTVVNLTAGERSFTSDHPYVNDGPGGPLPGHVSISVTVTDGDGASDVRTADLAINRAAPVADATRMFDPSPSYFGGWSSYYSPRLIAAGNVDDLSDPQGSNLDLVFLGNGFDWDWGMPTDWGGVLVGDGRGGFSQLWFDAGYEPRGLALGDFTGDGHADIAFGDPGGNVHLMAGDGYGNFAPPAAFSVGAGVANVAAGDFNGDGSLDLAIGHDSGSTVTVLISDRQGGFLTPATVNIGLEDAHALTVGYFDDAGKPAAAKHLDLAVTSYGSHRSVTILHGNGDGTFDLLPGQYDSGGDGPAYVTSGDFNNDGIADLAIANNSSSTVGVLLGNGDGSFQPVRTSDAVANGQYGADFLAAADFNRDGKLDLAVASSSGSQFRVLSGNGDGTFSRALSSAGFTALAAGDFDNDGKTDVAGTLPGSAVAAILWNRSGPYTVAEGGSLPLTAANSTDIDGNIVAYEWDLDGDGRFGETGPDALRGDEVGMYPNFSAVGLDGPSTWTVGLRVTDAGDLWSQSTADIQITNAAPTAEVAGPADGVPGQVCTFTLGATDPSLADQAADFTFAIDWNGDGTVDETVTGLSGMQVPHMFPDVGQYAVTVTATDKDGGASAPAVFEVSVTPVVFDEQNGELLFGGTSQADTLTVSFINDVGDAELELNGNSLGVFQGASRISIFGADGEDSLVVNGTSSADVLTKVEGHITWTAPFKSEILFADVAHVTINCGDGNDYVTDPGTDTTILGGSGDDTIVITATTGGGVVVDGQEGSDSYIVHLGSLEGPVTIHDQGAADTTTVTIVGTAGDDTLTLTGNEVQSDGQTIHLDSPVASLTVDGGPGDDRITVSDLSTPVASLVLEGGAGNDQVLVDGLSGVSTLTVSGGDGSDVLTVVDVGSSLDSLTLDGGTGTGDDQYQLPSQLPPGTEVQVQHVAPSHSPLVGPSSGVRGQPQSWTGSFVDPDPNTWTATVDYGDGFGAQTLAMGADKSFSLSHVYTDAGQYTITVQVTDSDGGVGVSTRGVTVTAVADTTTTVDRATATYGDSSVLVTAHVTANSPSTATINEGTVTFTVLKDFITVATVTSGTVANGTATGSLTLVGINAGTYSVEATYNPATGNPNFNGSSTLTAAGLTISKRAASVTPYAAGKNYGEADPTMNGVLSNLVAADGVTASYSRTPGEAVGAYSINATLNPASVLGNYRITYNTADFTIITVAGSVFILNPQVSGALTLSGNASLNIGGALFVDSSSSSAISASGNARVTAIGGVLVVGGVSKSGNAVVTETGIPGATVDPFSSLVAPVAAGTVPSNQLMSVNLSGNSTQTVNPGTYSQIKAAGNARLTLNPGVYIIAGGGISVTGNASVTTGGTPSLVTGTGVLIYNAGSNVVVGSSGAPSYGGIALSGNGTINLTAPTTGAYRGILIFQPMTNTRAMSLSGNAVTGITAGTIYAPAALMAMSGNAQLRNQVTLVVNQLQVSGNGSSALATDGVGTGSGVTAGELLASDLFLYVDDPNGSFSADDLARLDETIANLDVVLATYNVTVTEVSDRTLANLVLDTGTTSTVGGYANGVLGCFTNTGEITLIQGWNWYAGADPAAIGAGQYDFETIVTHELGHALGLGHSTDAGSVMYATLDTGAARRTMTVADLNLRDSGSGADALHAVPARVIAAYAAMMPAPSGLGAEAKDAFSTLSAFTPGEFGATSETFGLPGSSCGSLDSQAARVRDQFFQSLVTEKDQAAGLDVWLSSVRVGKGEAETIGSLSRLLPNTLAHKEFADESDSGFLDEELLEILAHVSSYDPV